MNLRGLAASGFRDRRPTELGDLGSVVSNEQGLNKISALSTLPQEPLSDGPSSDGPMRIVAQLVLRREERSLDIREAATGVDLLKALDLAPDDPERERCNRQDGTDGGARHLELGDARL